MSTPPALALSLRRDKDSPELTREPITAADLHEAQGEFWLAECLRRGRPDVSLVDFPSRVVPLLRDGGPRCTGFALESDDGARREFSLQAVSAATERAVRRLIEAGQLEAGDTYVYEIILDTRPRPSVRNGEAEVAFTTTRQDAALSYLTCPLPPLLREARSVGTTEGGDFPVIYTEAALARAERFARKGAASSPPIETGAVLIGPLCHCPETGEFFAVVREALEVRDAEGTQFSLTYSGKSWARIQAVLRARQAQPATRADRLLGQAHGHNFLPADGAPPCELCSRVKVCTRTSVFVSSDDRLWSRAVFAGQPWHLCHIFGLNARNEAVAGLFGLRDGRLQERGFHVVPDFDLSSLEASALSAKEHS